MLRVFHPVHFVLSVADVVIIFVIEIRIWYRHWLRKRFLLVTSQHKIIKKKNRKNGETQPKSFVAFAKTIDYFIWLWLSLVSVLVSSIKLT